MKRNLAMHNRYELVTRTRPRPGKFRRGAPRWCGRFWALRIIKDVVSGRDRLGPRQRVRKNLRRVQSNLRDVYRVVPSRISKFRYPWRLWTWFPSGRGLGFKEAA